jgi:glycosyltransferase involved in cell wall biosynthesis
MLPETHDRPLVSVLIVGYERPVHLERTVKSLRENLRYPHIEYIYTDDGSSAATLRAIALLSFDKTVSSQRSRGLGHNTNKGLNACAGTYIFQIQDDWVLSPGPCPITAALEVFSERPDISYVRYRPMDAPAQHELHKTINGLEVEIMGQDTFTSSKGYYGYTDNPHIKRRSFHHELGPYLEEVSMTVMEIEFCKRVDAQTLHKVAVFRGFERFTHIGEEHSFNPSSRNKKLRSQLSRFPVFRFLLRVHDRVKRLRTLNL